MITLLLSFLLIMTGLVTLLLDDCFDPVLVFNEDVNVIVARTRFTPATLLFEDVEFRQGSETTRPHMRKRSITLDVEAGAYNDMVFTTLHWKDINVISTCLQTHGS